MVLPMWLTGLGAAAQGFNNAIGPRQRQQMVQALLKRNAPSWGANNSVQNGVVRDQWGNPIGPAAGTGYQGSGPGGTPLAGLNPPDGGTGGAPPMDASAPSPDVWSQGGGATPFSPGSAVGSLPYQPPNMSPSGAVPYTYGSNMAGGQPQAGPFQPASNVDPGDPTGMGALFSSGWMGA